MLVEERLHNQGNAYDRNRSKVVCKLAKKAFSTIERLFTISVIDFQLVDSFVLNLSESF